MPVSSCWLPAGTIPTLLLLLMVVIERAIPPEITSYKSGSHPAQCFLSVSLPFDGGRSCIDEKAKMAVTETASLLIVSYLFELVLTSAWAAAGGVGRA
jgi:hypothetical protein